MLSTTPIITTSMVEVSVLLQLVPTMAGGTQQTTTTDMEAAQVARLHVLTTVVDLLLTITIDTVAAQALQLRNPTMAGATQQISTISMVEAPAVLQHDPTMVEALPQITMTDTEAA